MSKSIEELYSKLEPVTNDVPGTLLRTSMQREVGHFNVFNVEDLMRGSRDKPTMSFDRRAFYKISLIRGRSRVEFADKAVEVDQCAIWFASSRVPYRWLPKDAAQVGYFCIFTDEFLLPAKGGLQLDELPIFQPDSYPIWSVTNDEYTAIEAIFLKMTQEITSTFSYKYDLLRAYLLELIYVGQKLQPASALIPTHS
ncbi:MAG: AraC family transcriptional regulator, partial [Pedobacter sp.]